MRNTSLSSWVVPLLLALAGCGSSAATNSDGAAGDGPSGDTGPGVDVALVDGGADAGTLADGGGDTTTPAGTFVATVRVDHAFEDCMPIVAPDPLQVMGALEINNTGAVPIGPVTATQGILTTEGLMELGRFSIGSVQLDAVPPGATRSVPLMKMAGSLMPAGGCGMTCGTLVRIRVPISGANVAPGTIVSSPLTQLQCAM